MRSGLGSDQVLAVARVFTAVFLRSNGSLPKFPFSCMGASCFADAAVGVVPSDGYASWLLFDTSFATTDVRPVELVMCSVRGTPK